VVELPSLDLHGSSKVAEIKAYLEARLAAGDTESAASQILRDIRDAC
jgi:hypothetical protein